ncbi:hypothetical protein TNCV_2135331 [Trichonephila clavipes]|nr:hypothetical protein TNCV_2135331 [Trichonephila clavipes]
MNVRGVKKNMRLQKGTVDGYEWRCRNQSKDNRHDVVRSVRKGTWFSESKLAITIILRLTRYWFGKSMNEFVMNDLKVNKNMTNLIRHVAAILRSQVGIFGHSLSLLPRKICLEIMTTPKSTEPFEPIYPKIRFSRDLIKNALKNYITSEAFRVGILYGVEGVDGSSLFHIDENGLYGLNKVVIKGILQSIINSEYVAAEDDAVFQEIGCAFKELQEIGTENSPFLIEEMEKYKIAEEQKKYLKENRNQVPNALAPQIGKRE